MVLKPDQRNLTMNIFGKCKLKGVGVRAMRVGENSKKEQQEEKLLLFWRSLIVIGVGPVRWERYSRGVRL